jgi:glycine/D-amino acid oxidase-like deaminating enzyme
VHKARGSIKYCSSSYKINSSCRDGYDLTTTQTVDVVIVGGAAIGSSAAYFLATNPGFTGSVLVLEQDFSYARSATALSAASIRHQFSTPDNICMSQFGTLFIRQIADYLAVDGQVPDVGFQERGYLFLSSSAGQGVLQANHAVQQLELADGSHISCGMVINAAGTGASALARSAGIALPVQSRKRCVFYFTSPAQLPGCPLVIDPSGAYFRPEGEGFICGISPPENNDPECFDFEVHHALFDDVLWPLLAARVPGFEAVRVQRAWAGHYDVNTPDHNVILGAHPDLDNLLFANGFSGHGMQQSPAIGRALSELVVHGRYCTLNLSACGWQRVIDNQPMREVNVV